MIKISKWCACNLSIINLLLLILCEEKMDREVISERKDKKLFLEVTLDSTIMRLAVARAPMCPIHPKIDRKIILERRFMFQNTEKLIRTCKELKVTTFRIKKGKWMLGEFNACRKRGSSPNLMQYSSHVFKKKQWKNVRHSFLMLTVSYGCVAKIIVRLKSATQKLKSATKGCWYNLFDIYDFNFYSIMKFEIIHFSDVQ